MRHLVASIGLFIVLASGTARADILFYAIPGGKATMQLQGKVRIDTANVVTLLHPQFGTLYFAYEDVRFYRVASTLSLAQERLRKAKQDPKACLDAARWALHNGLLDECYKAAATAWTLDRNDPTVRRLGNLKRKMDAPLPVLKEQEDELRKYVVTAKNMEFVRSKHFLLMHDTKPSKTSGTVVGKKSAKTPAETRLDLLETVYETFLLKFYFEGLEIELPKQHLKAVLFADKNDFSTFSDVSRKGDPIKAAGFYNKKSNTAIFYDQGTDEVFKQLDEVNKIIQERARVAKVHRSPVTKDLVRFSKTLNVVCEMEKKNQDIEVVSHEATHQLAANTGLMPNEAAVPIWAAEGIATYFESPKEAAWAGVGTVNEGRLALYRGLASDTKHCNVEFVVSDNIFLRAGSNEEFLHGYGQAWALTHFLMAKHFDKLMKYYQLIGHRRSKDGSLFPPDQNIAIFKQAFGKDIDVLNAEWHGYMRVLKTDVERVVAGE